LNQPRAAHVWCLPLAAAGEAFWPAAFALLDADERERAGRFVHERNRREYIAAHALTRAMLSHFGGLPPQAWRFVLGPHGKPEIDPALGRPWLRFNLSHTRGAVSCAVLHERRIGVDIEALGRDPRDMSVADRFFAPAEVAQLRAVSESAREEMFLRIWTLKEALIKAVGLGISLGLDRFAFTLDPLGVRFAPEITAHDAAWRFHALRPTATHLLAVALDGDAPVRLRVLTPEELLLPGGA
jgi:4'-phosphopantetheinyl transferase